MKKLLLLLLFVFIPVCFANYYVPVNTKVKLYVPIYNNRSTRIIIYDVYPPKYCSFNSTNLPIIIGPFSSYELELFCKFPKGKYNLTLKLLEINGYNYPETDIYLNVISQKSRFYVFVNDGIIPSKSKYLYHINVGDVIKIIYYNSSIPYQETRRLRILYIGNFNNSTYYIYARAESPGIDSIVLDNQTSILFKISISKQLKNYLEANQLIYLVYNFSNHTDLLISNLKKNVTGLFSQLLKNMTEFINEDNKFKKSLSTTIKTALNNMQKNQKETNKNLEEINKSLKNLTLIINNTILLLNKKDKKIMELQENISQLKLKLINETNQYNHLLCKYNQLASEVSSIIQKNAFYTILIYLLAFILVALAISMVALFVYFKKRIIPRYESRIRRLNETIQELERNPFSPKRELGGRR